MAVAGLVTSIIICLFNKEGHNLYIPINKMNTSFIIHFRIYSFSNYQTLPPK